MNAVILVPNWLRDRSLIITLLSDYNYMEQVRQTVAELSRGSVAAGMSGYAA